MAEIKEILNLVKSISPEKAVQPDFEDNVGLLIGSENGWTERVLTCLDATEGVLEEAHELGATLVLSHHPVIFEPVRSVTDKTNSGRVITYAIKHSISVYSAHTNLDFCEGGINDYNAKLVGLRAVQPMQVQSGIKIGRIGDLFEPIALRDLTSQLREKFSDNFARYVGEGDEMISRVAIINGGGGKVQYIEEAASLGADCYISADFPHHALLHAKECGMNVIHMQHYSMEYIYINKWTEMLNRIAASGKVNVQFIQAKNESNPTQTEDL